MTFKPTGPSDRIKRKLARKLWTTKKRIWRDVSDYLMAPKKNRVNIKLYRLNKNTKDGETVVIPGKVLANGDLDHKLTIACYNLSKSAYEKIKSSGSERITIEELYERNPSGSNVKIII